MHRILAVLVAVAGLIGFAAVAQADCSGHMDMADSGSTTIATDTTTKPILPDGSGG